jgi:hypothetical protein
MQYGDDGITNIDTNSRYDPMKEKSIAQLAYDYWDRRGRPFGSPEEDWFRAEREIRARTSWAITPSDRGSG